MCERTRGRGRPTFWVLFVCDCIPSAKRREKRDCESVRAHVLERYCVRENKRERTTDILITSVSLRTFGKKGGERDCESAGSHALERDCVCLNERERATHILLLLATNILITCV